MIVESFPSNITYWGAVVFEKWVKQCHENTFVNDFKKICLMRQKLFSWHCFTHFPKTTVPQRVIFSGKLSTIIIFKLCKFSFLSYKSYIDPLSSSMKLATDLTDWLKMKYSIIFLHLQTKGILWLNFLDFSFNVYLSVCDACQQISSFDQAICLADFVKWTIMCPCWEATGNFDFCIIKKKFL